MEHTLRALLPRIVPDTAFDIRTFRGKTALRKKLPDRMRGYARWVSAANTKIVVVVDRDDEDCLELKADLERVAKEAGLPTRAVGGEAVTVVNRIVVTELESWFLGDVPALCAVYPRVPKTLGEQRKYRDPDTVTDAWEALERVLQKHGYHDAGLPKLHVAGQVSPHMDVENNRSPSFRTFRDGVRRLVSEEEDGQAD